MKTSAKAIIIAITVAIVLILAGLIIALNQRPEAAPEPTEGAPQQTVRTNSHVLDDGGPDAVTVVEFIDFECEACGAFYPIVEDLRQKYEGQITYVIRYFPLPGHRNSTQAALAAEAAAQQNRFEDMYNRLFQTQPQWGENQEETPEVFRGFAQDLGLDMAAYDAAIADPATLERVQLDVRDGQQLGVNSTPTFFVNGTALQLERFDDLETAITTALQG